MPLPYPYVHRFLTLLAAVSLVAACGGDASAPETPSGQSVTVSVSTGGPDPDPDGYVVTLGTRSEAVGVNGSAVFEGVTPGSWDVELTDVAGNCSVDGGTARSVSVTETAGANLSFSVTCEVDYGDGFDTVPCPAFAPEAAQGVPGDRLAAGTLPTELEAPLFARVLVADGSVAGHTYLTQDEEGAVELVVPLHPSGDTSGGEVQIRASDGRLACAPVNLTIAPLAAAEGELSAVVELLQQLLAQQASALGTTVDALVETPLDELPTYLVPLGAVQSVVWHPDNPNSLRAIADGTAPDYADAPLELLDALVARTGLKEAIAESLDAAGGSGGPPVLADLECDPLSIGGDAARLDQCMDAQASAAFRVAGASGRLVKKLGDLIGVLGFVPGLGTATAIAGATVWATLNADARTVALLPSSLVSMDLVAAPGVLREDDPVQGTWSASVTAENGGWDMGKEILEAMLQLAGVLGAFDKSELPGDALASTLAGVASGPISERLLGPGTLEDFKIEPETFGPVSVSADAWSEARILGDAVRLVAGDSSLYEAWSVGAATLSVRTEDGEFGGKQIAEQVDIEVRALDLDITPAQAVAGPDDVLTFEVVVTGAAFPDRVAIDPGPDQGGASIEYIGEGVHRVSYTAPGDPDFTRTDLLTVRYTGTTTGARRNDPEPRTASAAIGFGDLEITASSTACVPPGEPVDLEAAVEGVDDAVVEWAVAGPASIESTGPLTATLVGSEEGSVTVSAQVAAAPGLVAELTVEIGTCACAWTVTVDGTQYVGQPGDGAEVVEVSENGSTGLYGLELTTTGGRYVFINPSDSDGNGIVAPRAPGTWSAEVAGNIGTSSFLDLFSTRYPGPYVGPDPPEWTTAELLITAYETADGGHPALVAGSAAGSVTDSSEQTLSFEVSFQIALAPGSWSCTITDSP